MGPRAEYDALTERYHAASRRLHPSEHAERTAAIKAFRRAAALDARRKRAVCLFQAIARGFLVRARVVAANTASSTIALALRRRRTVVRVERRTERNVAARRAVEDVQVERIDATVKLQHGWRHSRRRVEGRTMLAQRRDEAVKREREAARLKAVLLVQRNFRRNRPAFLFGVLMDTGPQAGSAGAGAAAASSFISFMMLRTMPRAVALARAIDGMRDRLVIATALLTPDVPTALVAAQQLASVPISGLWHLMEHDRNSLVAGALAAACLILGRSPTARTASALVTVDRAALGVAVAGGAACPRLPPRALRAARRLVHGMQLRVRLDAAAARQLAEDADAAPVEHVDDLDALVTDGGSRSRGGGGGAGGGSGADGSGGKAQTPKMASLKGLAASSRVVIPASQEAGRRGTVMVPRKLARGPSPGGTVAAMGAERSTLPTGDGLIAARALATWCDALLAVPKDSVAAAAAWSPISTARTLSPRDGSDHSLVDKGKLVKGVTGASGGEMSAGGGRTGSPRGDDTPGVADSDALGEAATHDGIEGVLFSPAVRPLMSMSGLRLARAVARGVDMVTAHESAATRDAQEPEAVAVSLYDAIELLRTLVPADAEVVRALRTPPAGFLGLVVAVRRRRRCRPRALPPPPPAAWRNADVCARARRAGPRGADVVPQRA